MGDGEECNEYRKELDILNKMMEEKCDSYKAKGILGYRKGKSYATAARTKTGNRTKKTEKK